MQYNARLSIRQGQILTQTQTFSDRLRHTFRGLTQWAGSTGARLGISPDAVTIAGTLLVAVAAWQAALGHFLIAGVILILGMPLDVLDGAIARATNRKSRFGALLDSTLDRYADGFMLLGLATYFSTNGQQAEMVISGLALIGAYAVSYVRARAEGLNIPIKEGWFSRVERTIILIAALLSGWVVPGVIILAIGNHVTALQRIRLVWLATRAD